MGEVQPLEKFMRISMRHLDVLRNAQPLDDTPYPDGWFDLPEKAQTDLGAMIFLFARSNYHRRQPLGAIYNNLETPLRLNQYRLFNGDGYPRACVTWAGLDHEAEQRLAVERKPLRPEQWNSGKSHWVMDFAAPFGHLEQVMRLLTESRSTNRVRTLWHNKLGTRARVIEWERAHAGAEITVASYGQNQFAKKLRQEG